MTSNVQRCIGDSRARRGRFIQSWPELRFIPRVKNPPAIEIWDLPSWTEEEVLTRCGVSIAHTQDHKLPPNAKGYQSSSRIIVKVPKTVSNYPNNPFTPQITESRPSCHMLKKWCLERWRDRTHLQERKKDQKYVKNHTERVRGQRIKCDRQQRWRSG